MSLTKNFLLSLMSFGDDKMHELVTIDKMKRLEPSNTPSPSYMPSTSESSLALKLEKISLAPEPKASNVTPASDSESLKFFAIFYSDGLKCSSATKDKQKKARKRHATC